MSLNLDRPVQCPRASRLLSVLVFLTLATALVEGYLSQLHPHAAKVAPALLVLAWTAHLLRRVRLPVVPTVSWLVLGLALTVLTSSALNTGNPYLLDENARWLPFILVTVALVDLLSRVVDPRVAVSALVTGAIIASGGALYSVLDGQPRAVGPMTDSNDLAYVLMSAVPFVVLAPPPPYRRRLVQLAVFGLLVAGAAATLSRGALVATVIGVGWLLARRLVPLRVVLPSLAALTVFATLLMAAPPQALQTALAQKSFVASTNVDSRLLRWEAAARLVADNPVLGTGPGGVRHNYVAASGNAELVEQTPATHNMYLHVAADLGMVGLLLLALVMAAAYVAARYAEVGRRQGEAVAVQGSLLLIAVMSVFLSEHYYMSLWAALALGASLWERTRTELGIQHDTHVEPSSSRVPVPLP